MNPNKPKNSAEQEESGAKLVLEPKSNFGPHEPTHPNEALERQMGILPCTYTSKPKNEAAVALGRLGGLAPRKRSRESYVAAGRAGGLAPHKKRKSKQQEEEE